MTKPPQCRSPRARSPDLQPLKVRPDMRSEILRNLSFYLPADQTPWPHAVSDKLSLSVQMLHNLRGF